MNWAISLLIICNILIPAGFIVRGCLSKRGIEVNHILLFSIGFIFYWILPIIVGFTRFFQFGEEMDIGYPIFDSISNITLIYYLVVCLGAYLSFGFGSVVSKVIFTKSSSKNKILFINMRLLNLYLFLGVIASCIFAVMLKDRLFMGYTAYDTDYLQGSFTASSMFLLSIAFIYAVKFQEKYGVSTMFSKLLFNRYFVVFFMVSVLVLSLGGRLFVLSSLFMILVFKTVYCGRIKKRYFLLFLVFAILLSGLIGIIRSGDYSVSFNALVINLFAEPIYTSLSLLSFLRDHQLEAINFPRFLLSGFINLVPSFILPSKAELIYNPEAYGYTIYAPGGALNSFTSFMINFGIVGTFVFLFLFSFFLGFLKARKNTLLHKVIYIMTSGLLAFSFYRESFQQSIVKEIFEFSILIPIIVVLSLHLLSIVIRDASKPSILTSHQKSGYP